MRTRKIEIELTFEEEDALMEALLARYMHIKDDPFPTEKTDARMEIFKCLYRKCFHGIEIDDKPVRKKVPA